jgi:hypothetical protein
MRTRSEFNVHFRVCVPGLLFSVWAASALAQAPAGKHLVANQSDLPRHSYAVDVAASELVVGAEPAFSAFAAQVRKNLDATFADYDIRDRATLRELLQLRLQLELLAGENEPALKTLAELRTESDKTDAKLAAGLVDEAILQARLQSKSASGAALAARAAAELTTLVTALPWPVVRDEVKEHASRLEIVTGKFAVALVKHDVDPSVAQSRTVNDEGAAEIVAARRQMSVIDPLRPALIEALKTYIAAHNVQKPDIWAARDVELGPDGHLVAVLVGVWDSGVDSTVLADHMHSDAQHPGRSAHGLAFSQDGSLSAQDLRPITDEQRAYYPTALKLFQGFNDVQNQIDSPEAAEVHKLTSNTPPGELPGKIKQILLAGSYLHGTHVAGDRKSVV